MSNIPIRQGLVRHSRFKVDEGLEMLQKGQDPAQVFEGWSQARIKAFKQIDKKPNAYYYRFNAPGEKQGSGAWSQQEKDLFFKRLEEVGADGQWGIFSMAIPGRVGYQCSNFYRHLIKTGEIVDPNYTIDEKGELRYLFGKKDGGEGVVRSFARTGQAAAEREGDIGPRKKRKVAGPKKAPIVKKKTDDDCEGGDKDDSGTFVSFSKSVKSPYVSVENPLQGYIDPITLQEIVKPAISPYGHVAGYDTWIRCLGQEPKNICPFTKQPLSKRELVVLTFDNIEEYRSKII